MNNLKVSTWKRDRRTEYSPRSIGDGTHYTLVGSNTADEELFKSIDGDFPNDVWANDNLQKLADAGHYKNTREWKSKYNATIVAGIKNIEIDRKIQWRALFCVDNMVGGFDNEDAKYYAREIAARLSVMIYRYKVLKTMKEEPWIISTLTVQT